MIGLLNYAYAKRAFTLATPARAETYKTTKNPYRSVGVAIALTITQDEMIDKATKSIKENTLNKDVEK